MAVGKMQVMPPAVAGVAVVSDPAEGRARLILLRLGHPRKAVDVVPGAARGEVGDDVQGEADRVLAVGRMRRVGRVAVGYEDLVLAAEELDVPQ